MRNPRTSLIISSYNQPNALRLVVEGVLTQSQGVDEVVVADDGSEADTHELVEEFAARAPFPVTFTTQEDAGFRKAKALNNAIRAATGEHVLFLDGDCIPPPAWAARFHRALLRWDFAVAGYVWMDLPRSEAVDVDRIARGLLDEVCTEKERRAFRRMHRKETFYRLIRKAKKPRILGGNWAVRRDALVAVNGFDERFEGFTKEDSDIRNRLRNAGFVGRSLWNTNWVYHCSHDLDPRRNLPNVLRGKPDYAYYASRARAVDCDQGLVRRPTG